MQLRVPSLPLAVLGFLTLALAFPAPAARADVRYLYSAIDGNQEVPPVPTAATGQGLYILNDVLGVLEFEITFQNLSSPENAAHFHGPAPAGASAGVLFNLPAGSPKLGTWPVNATQIGHLLNGLVYANIHTNLWPGGEIRGQLEVLGRGYCFGDGTGTPCPCANSAGPHEGCRNSSGFGGRLRPAGELGPAPASLRMVADRLLPGQPVLLFRGGNAVNGGNGAVFGDGLRCVGGAVVRLGVRIPDASGRAQWDLGSVLAPPPGQFLRYQGWFRDPPSPCGTGFNLTNGVELQ